VLAQLPRGPGRAQEQMGSGGLACSQVWFQTMVEIPVAQVRRARLSDSGKFFSWGGRLRG